MEMAPNGFKLFHTLFLVLAWQCCGKVGATFGDVTGSVEPALDRKLPIRAFGSHGTQASAVAPVSSVGGKVLVVSQGHEISTAKSAGSVVVSHGRKTGPNANRGSVVAISSGHEISKKSGASSVVVSHGGKTGVNNGSSSLVAVSQGQEITKKGSSSIIVSRGSKTGVNGGSSTVAVSTGHEVSAKSGSSVVISHKGKIGANRGSRSVVVASGQETRVKSATSTVVSHGHGAAMIRGGAGLFSHGIHTNHRSSKSFFSSNNIQTTKGADGIHTSGSSSVVVHTHHQTTSTVSGSVFSHGAFNAQH
ncbi:hypothetical protein Csa_016517 [Cucumis sativus]|uniref:Ankyrin repeat protein n=1 Tax=Cucumis sativus TaxID=3659 RepID=A0A0A0K662_CUCSA|nr:hypothetical protein Csa_016517 [Cucumis sativus]